MQLTETLDDFYKRHSIDKTTGINSECGHFNVYSRKDMLCRPAPVYSRRDFYKISLIIGEGVLHYASKSIEVNKPALLFSNPNVPYSWEPASDEQDGYFCLFKEGFIVRDSRNDSLNESPLFKIGGSPLYFLDEKQTQNANAIFGKMAEELDTDYVYKYDLIRNYINLLIHEAMKLQPADTFVNHINASSRISALFMELLERQFPVDAPANAFRLKTAKDYASRLSVHINHLNRAVKETTGRTTTEHIAARITKEAKDLLLHTDWNVSEIGYALGFEYPAHFNNFFKKHSGQTPRLFREVIV